MNRAVGFVCVAVGLAGCKKPPRTEIPTMAVARAGGAITLDGVFNEPDWARAGATGDLIDTLTGGFVSSRNASGDVRALWTPEGLVLGWRVRDRSVDTTLRRGVDAHLWEDDCVEVMLDPGADGRDYYEIQIDPSGNVFDTMYRTRRVPRPFGIDDWSSRVAHGGAVTDGGYSVEMRIPWDALGVQNPGPGTVLSGNFYLMDRIGSGQKFAGWSAPLVGDFHVPERFGRLSLAP